MLLLRIDRCSGHGALALQEATGGPGLSQRAVSRCPTTSLSLYFSLLHPMHYSALLHRLHRVDGNALVESGVEHWQPYANFAACIIVLVVFQIHRQSNSHNTKRKQVK